MRKLLFVLIFILACAVYVSAQTTGPATSLASTTTAQGDQTNDFNLYILERAPGAATVALAGAGAGNTTNGTHQVKVVFTTATSGHTNGGTASAAVTVVDNAVNGKIAISSIPTGPAFVSGRKIYLTKAGGTTYYLLSNGTIADNTTTTLTANDSDTTLNGAAVLPTNNTTLNPIIQYDGPTGVVTVGGATVGTITGSGTANTLPKFTAATTIGNSAVTDNATTFAIATNKFTVTEASGNTFFAGVLSGGSGPTTITDAAGKILSAALNTVAVAQGGTGTGSTLVGLVRGNASAMTAAEISGDATTSGSNVLTLASVISAGGPTGSATVAPIITYDAKGRLTTVSSATITPPISAVTGLGTGVAAAAAVSGGSLGAFLLNNLAQDNAFVGDTGGIASAKSIGSCSAASSALTYNTTTHAWGCNTITTGLTVGTTAIASGTTTRILYDNAGVLGEYTVSGTGTSVPLTAGPTFTGTVALAALTASSTITQTVSSATAFEIGPNGGTNPVLRVITNVASQADGISISGGAAGAGTTIAALSSGSNSSIILTPKGTGQVVIPDGALNTPSMGFASDLQSGFYRSGNQTIGFGIVGTAQFLIGGNLIRMQSSENLGWASGSPISTNVDLTLIRAGAANLQLGSAAAASPVAQTISTQGSRSGTDTNVAGGNLTIQSGTGTGNSTGSSLIFNTPIAVASGTGAQTQTATLTLQGGNTTVGGTLTGPTLIGGTTTTSTLTLRPTSGAGTTNADLIFQVGNNGATEAMRITNAGYIGIGTASPDLLPFGANAGRVLTLQSSNSKTSVLELSNNSTGTTGRAGQIVGYNGSTPLATVLIDADGATNSGKVSVITYSAGVSGTGLVVDKSGHIFMPNISTAAGATGADACFQGAGATQEITTDTALCIVSARRFKNSIQSDHDGLAFIKQLRPVHYFLNEAPERGRQYGFVAEEVEKVNKDFVTYQADGQIRSVLYIEIIEKLTLGMQEQQRQLETLRKEVDALKARQ